MEYSFPFNTHVMKIMYPWLLKHQGKRFTASDFRRGYKFMNGDMSNADSFLSFCVPNDTAYKSLELYLIRKAFWFYDLKHLPSALMKGKGKFEFPKKHLLTFFNGFTIFKSPKTKKVDNEEVVVSSYEFMWNPLSKEQKLKYFILYREIFGATYKEIRKNVTEFADATDEEIDVIASNNNDGIECFKIDWEQEPRWVFVGQNTDFKDKFIEFKNKNKMIIGDRNAISPKALFKSKRKQVENEIRKSILGKEFNVGNKDVLKEEVFLEGDCYENQILLHKRFSFLELNQRRSSLDLPYSTTIDGLKYKLRNDNSLDYFTFLVPIDDHILDLESICKLVMKSTLAVIKTVFNDKSYLFPNVLISYVPTYPKEEYVKLMSHAANDYRSLFFDIGLNFFIYSCNLEEGDNKNSTPVITNRIAFAPKYISEMNEKISNIFTDKSMLKTPLKPLSTDIKLIAVSIRHADYRTYF